MRSASIGTLLSKTTGGRVRARVCMRARAGDGTEAHAPRRKITGVDLDTAPFADLLSDRAEGTGERETRPHPGATGGWRRRPRRRKRARDQTRSLFFPPPQLAPRLQMQPCPSSRPSRCSPFNIAAFFSPRRLGGSERAMTAG